MAPDGDDAALMIGGAVVLDLLAGIIIRRVFGPAYEGAIEIFRWAVWLSVPAASRRSAT